MTNRDAWNADLYAPRWDDMTRAQQNRLEDFVRRVGDEERITELEIRLEEEIERRLAIAASLDEAEKKLHKSATSETKLISECDRLKGLLKDATP